MDNVEGEETTGSGSKDHVPTETGKPLREVKSSFRQMLELAGLPEYEREVLSTLVFEGRLEAKTIAQKADVPKSKIYDVLDSLTGKGLVFCEDEAARPKKYLAARPEIIQDNLTRDLQRIRELNDEIEAELAELYEAGIEGAAEEDISNYISVQDSEAAIASEMFNALSGSETIRASGEEFRWLQESEHLRETVSEVAASGGDVKLLTSQEEPSTTLHRLASSLTGSGVGIRATGDLESRAIIVDEEIVLIEVRKRSPKATEPDSFLVRLESTAIASDLLTRFMTSWMEAEPLEGRE